MKWPVVLLVGAVALVVGGVLASATIRQDREFRRLITEGDIALEAGQTSVAIEALSGAVALRNDSMLAYLKRGDTYRQRGDWEAALRDLTRASILEPSAPRPLELLGDVYAAIGRYAQAIDAYRRFLALDDRSPRVLYKLALAHYRSGDAARAIEPLQQALSIDDGLREVHYLLGVCLATLNRNTDAVRAFTRALDIDETFEAAREELARIDVARGRHLEALSQLEALAQLDPLRVERTIAVADAYAALGRMDAAIATLTRAAQRFPDHPAVDTALGRLWLTEAEAGIDSGAATRAVAALQRSASRPDATSDALALYGRALFLAGRLQTAEAVLQDATSRLPIEPIAYRYLAAAADRLRHRDIATEAMRRYQVLRED